MKYDKNNIFAKIIEGIIKTDKIYESEYAISFNDISPKSKIHVLVIPKGEYINFSDFTKNASEQEIAEYYKAINKTIEILGIANGYRLISNTGEHGGQEVPHFHTHILAGEYIGKMRS